MNYLTNQVCIVTLKSGKEFLKGGKVVEREVLLEYLEERRFKELKEELEYMHPVDIAELMEELEDKQMILVFRLLDKDAAAEMFTEMEAKDQRETILTALTDSEIAEFMEEMYLDDTVDVMEEMHIVSEPNGQKPRETLITKEDWQEKLASY